MTMSKLNRVSAIALLAVGMASVLPGISGTASAQPYGYDDDRRPPPPPRDDDYRRPPPPDGYGYYRRPPPPRYGDDDDDRPLMCRTPEGTCRGRGPRFYRARCFCDFGDGPVSGRMR